jgi:hypothetical protein
MVNIHAQALGRLGAGRKKTMSREAIKQRREAAKRKRIRSGAHTSKEVENSLKKSVDITETLS